jgi:hypothetical protein
MKKGSFLSLPLLCFFLTVALPAIAQQTLYENGPINGNQDAFTINFGFVVSDTFTISGGNSVVNGLSFGAWLEPGDMLESAEATEAGRSTSTVASISLRRTAFKAH